MSDPLARLIGELGRLPGIGPKTATRLSHHLLRVSRQEAENLSAAILDRAEASRLLRGIRSVLKQAIAAGGSSLRDYRNADGEPGWFQVRHRVYDREGEPCGRCRAAIERVVVASRSTWFCPHCQPGD